MTLRAVLCYPSLQEITMLTKPNEISSPKAVVCLPEARLAEKPDMPAIIAASIAKHQKTLDKLAKL